VAIDVEFVCIRPEDSMIRNVFRIERDHKYRDHGTHCPDCLSSTAERMRSLSMITFFLRNQVVDYLIPDSVAFVKVIWMLIANPMFW